MKAEMRLAVFACMLVLAGAVLAGAAEEAEDVASKIEKWREEYEQVTGDDSIRAAAENEEDVEILLGLAMLARQNVAEEIRKRAVEINPSRAAVFYSAIRRGWGPDGAADEDFARADPFNAMPHYRRAASLYERGMLDEALAAFRQGTSYKQMRTYRGDVARGLFKAMDALGLEGPVRLMALNYAEARTRVGAGMPHQVWTMIHEAAERMQPQDKNDLAENLLSMAGQAIRSEEYAWSFAVKNTAILAMLRAYRIKAGLAAKDDSPKQYAYIETAEVLRRQFVALLRESTRGQRFHDAVGHAVPWVPSALRDIKRILETEKDLDDSARSRLEDVKRRLEKSLERFIDLAAADPDGTLGLWISETDTDPASALEIGFPALADAAEEVLEAEQTAKETAEDLSGGQRTRQRLKQLGLGLLMYANDHEGAFPEDHATLRQIGYEREDSGILSGLSGKTFAYTGAGHADSSHPATIVAYDEAPSAAGTHWALFADGHVAEYSTEMLEQQLEKQKQ